MTDDPTAQASDEAMMRRCFDLAVESVRRGGHPFGAVVARMGQIVVETPNRVFQDGDVTRHAEVVALSQAQRALRRTSLDDCTLYSNVEPCAYCSYAIRETRVGRVVFALASPVMGGLSRWNILADERLSSSMPEVFASPPAIRPCFMAHEADAILRRAAPLVWAMARSRGLFAQEIDRGLEALDPEIVRRRSSAFERTMGVLRAWVFDRYGGRPGIR